MIDGHRLPPELEVSPLRLGSGFGRLFHVVKPHVVTHPEGAFNVANNGPNHGISQTFSLGKRFPLPVALPSGEAPAGDAYPKRALAILKHRGNAIRGQSAILTH